MWIVINRSKENRKKDLLALLMILNFISELQSNQINIKKGAKENWEICCRFYVRMDHVVQAKMQILKMEFETISMKRKEKVDVYSNRFARVITNLRDFGENLHENDVVSRRLRSVPKEINDLILLLEQTSDLKSMRLDEAFGQLKVHELRLQERNSRDEDQALLSRVFNKSKKDQKGSSTSERECGRKGKSKDCGNEVDREKKKKPFD